MNASADTLTERRPGGDGAAPTPRPKPLGEPPANTITPDRRIKQPEPTPAETERGANAESPAAKRKRSNGRDELVPPDVAEKFLKVGNQYFFPDRTRAFTDQGKRLVAHSENTEVIRALTAIAQARGWEQLKVTGSQRFRREVAREAQALGLTIKGKSPEPAVPQAPAKTDVPSAKANSSNADAPGNAPSAREEAPPPTRRSEPVADRVIYGQLLDAGPARYRNDPAQSMSFFVTLATDKGERTFWGVQLQSALNNAETRPAIGDEVGIRRLASERVQVRVPVADEQGRVTGEESREAVRNRWQVEQRAYFEREKPDRQANEKPTTGRQPAERSVPPADPKEKERLERARAFAEGRAASDPKLRTRPEVASALATERIAALFAQQYLQGAVDQAQFVKRVRERVARALERGERVPTPAVRAPAERERGDSDRGRE